MGLCNTTEQRAPCCAADALQGVKAKNPKMAKALDEIKNETFGLDAAEAARRREQIRHVFDHFDINHADKITLEEFITMARAFEGSALTDEIGFKLYKRLDDDCNGDISRHELATFFLMKTSKLDRESFDHILDTTWVHEAVKHTPKKSSVHRKKWGDIKRFIHTHPQQIHKDDHTEFPVEHSMVDHIKEAVQEQRGGASPAKGYTYAELQQALKKSRYSDFIAYYTDNAKKREGYKPEEKVTESDLLTAVTGYLGRTRGRATKQAEEALMTQREAEQHRAEEAQ